MDLLNIFHVRSILTNPCLGNIDRGDQVNVDEIEYIYMSHGDIGTQSAIVYVNAFLVVFLFLSRAVK